MDKPVFKVTVNSSSWVMINSGSAGFFHVKYSAKLFALLMENISNLSTIDRLKLSSDLFCLCRAGLETSDKYLTLFKAYSSETEYSVLSDILDGISVFQQFAQHLGISDQLNSLIVETISPAAMGIGWDAKEGEGHTIPLLRPLLFKSLGIAGHAETKERAREAFGMIKG